MVQEAGCVAAPAGAAARPPSQRVGTCPGGPWSFQLLRSPSSCTWQVSEHILRVTGSLTCCEVSGMLCCALRSCCLRSDVLV